MKAGVYYGPGDLRVTEVKVPATGPDDILVRVKECGICASEIRTFQKGSLHTKPPRILGHEVTGGIAEVGSKVRGFSVGMRVVLYPTIACGRCSMCRSGKQENLCLNADGLAWGIDGGLAEYVLAPGRMVANGGVCEIPEGASYSEAALSEPMSCALNSLSRLRIPDGGTMLIIGAGTMGFLHLILAKRVTPVRKVIVSEMFDDRLDLAKKLGADYTINPSKENVEERMKELTDGEGADGVVTAVGSPTVIEQALKLVRRTGVLNIFGGCPPGTTIKLDPNVVHYNELTVTGTIGGSLEMFKKCLSLIGNHEVDVRPLITHHFPLDRVNEAFKAAQQSNAFRVLVEPSPAQ
jgi:L-iditol 2-dehydrogenase